MCVCNVNYIRSRSQRVKTCKSNCSFYRESHPLFLNVVVVNVCGFSFIFRSHEDDGQVRLCPTCGKEFRKKNDLYAHMRRHTNPKRFLCPKCGKAFKSASTSSLLYCFQNKRRR